MSSAPQIPIQAVESPIICNPYDEPNDHWKYDTKTGRAQRTGFRRDAGYWYKTDKVGSAQQDLFAEEERDDLPLVNRLRKDVKRWREADYRGASAVTRDLLRHWSDPQRARRLFFCQREAIETLIYLAEIRIPGKSSRTLFKDFEVSEENLSRLLRAEKPDFGMDYRGNFYPKLVDGGIDSNLIPLRRLGCKMATGSGKTVVMAMLISWAFCNRGTNPESQEFPSAVLICAPNLTVKDRLQVLRPEHPDNYYTAFDIVPVKYRPLLQKGKVLIENWHQLGQESEHKEGDRSYAVVNKGPETPETLARRVLGDLYERMPIMVINDEGHHCWRPAPNDEDELSKEEKKELEQEAEEARIWLQGLDWINNAPKNKKPGILFCADLSATPFYLKGSGYPEGQPFPWLISDFGLVDAIESGIVKIPRLPVLDDAKGKDDAGRPDPKYFRLWHNITENLKPGEKLPSGRPRPQVAYREAEGALLQIAGQWVERFKYIQDSSPTQDKTPPVLIIVCDNTDIAEEVFRKISGEQEAEAITQEDVDEVLAGDDEEAAPKAKGKAKKKIVYGKGVIFPEFFSNTPTSRRTIRIDTKLLAEAESQDPNKSRQQAAEELRHIIATVGKKGQPGEFVRCVVSVSMLTEGWDACNVTHILGIRAFGSQLLCEQVVGRGLRRMNYDPDTTTGLLPPEYVDVYGIPFSVIPFKGRPVDKPEPDDKPQHRVWAVRDRDDFEIRFPIVEGYVFALKKNILKCDVDTIEAIEINPKLEPTTTYVRPTTGYVDTYNVSSEPAAYVTHDRHAYYGEGHFQQTLFRITQRIIDDLLSPLAGENDKRRRVLRLQSRHQLFPQVFKFVEGYAMKRVVYNGVDRRELGLEKYARLVIERIRDRIYPDDASGEPPLLPVLNRYKPFGSTNGVDFVTKRPVTPTKNSHINLVVQHSTWEAAAAERLEQCAHVRCYARNDHLGLTVPYDFYGISHSYEPDFIVSLENKVNVLLEIKGFEVHEIEKTNHKHNAARRWVQAVNNLGEFGRWDFLVCRQVECLTDALKPIAIKC